MAALVMFLLLSPMLYGGGYLACLDGKLLVHGTGSMNHLAIIYDYWPRYRFAQEFCEDFFYPAHLVDRAIRPDHWDPFPL